jgi:hypothetical protein
LIIIYIRDSGIPGIDNEQRSSKMGKEWFGRLVQAAAITVTIAAVCQEMEKPQEERRWHGNVGIVPYDFRLPTLERLKEAYWNKENPNLFNNRAFGVGWAVNFHALLEKIRILREYYASEEDFLMPTKSLKKVLEDRPAAL